MRKVLIIGSGGAGKSTLARRIAERTGLPLIHLDSQYWHDGWVPTPDAEWDRVVAEMLRGDAWIIDGNYGRTLSVRLEACDTVVFLDLPRLTCMWRVLKRQVEFRGRERPDLPSGCPERLSLEFVVWVWQYRRLRRPGIIKQLAELRSTKQVIVLSNQESIERFVAGLPAPDKATKGRRAQ